MQTTIRYICLLFYVFLGSFSLYSSPKELPLVIDFKTFQAPNVHCDRKNMRDIAPSAFSSSAEIGSFFDYIKHLYSINTVVETGTYFGATTLWFSYLFDSVHTIELLENYYTSALCTLEERSNVSLHLGSSEIVLSDILPQMQETSLVFYLDAHWYSYWPLLNELEEISKTHRDNCIIIVNDIKVPGREDIPYDSYNGFECSYEYIKPQLDKIFSEYSIHYLIPEDVHCRAKLIAIPKLMEQMPMEEVEANDSSLVLLVDNCGGVSPDRLTEIFRRRNQNIKVLLSNIGDLNNPLAYQTLMGDLASKILFFNIPGDMIAKAPTLNPLKEKMVLFMYEPPLILKDMYSEEVLSCFSKIYTWNDELVDNINFFKFYYPVMYPPIDNPPSFQEKKLCTLIVGNGKKSDPYELYSERIRAIEFFEAIHEKGFEFYGRMSDPQGYDFTKYRSYRGSVNDKIAKLKNYRFSICYENSKNLSGYVTEKIFNCFQACNVPIYWGASNIEQYVPKNCFIDRRDFSSLDDLYNHIKHMSKKEYNGYIRRIRKYLKSEEAKLFSPMYFNKTLIESIQ